MLRTSIRHLCLLAILVTAVAAIAHADSTTPADSACYGTNLAQSEGYLGVSKVKPSSPTPLKVKPWPSFSAGFQGLSRYNPAEWGLNCCLPTPAKGQFLVGPKVFFARVQGQARRGLDQTPGTATVVDFDDHLGFRKTGNTIWSIDAYYQFRPRWGLRYSFTPLHMDATHSPLTGFTIAGQSFQAGSPIHASWKRYEHRAGVVFNLSRRPNSLTNLFAEWIYVQDRLSIRSAGGTATAGVVRWDDDKSAAMIGLEFNKCLKNYKGNTLAFNAKGGVAFLDDTVGYDAEAGLSYLIPIKTGRFGFVSAGYRYSRLQKDRNTRMFGTTLDGAFLKAGFLF